MCKPLSTAISTRCARPERQAASSSPFPLDHLPSSLFDFLPMELPGVRAEMIPHEERIAELFKTYAEDLGEAAWSALASFAKVSARAACYMIEGVDADNTAAAMSAARSLYWVESPTYGASSESLEAVVRRLLAIGVAHADTRAAIAQPVSSLVLRDSLRSHVVACLVELSTVPSEMVRLKPVAAGSFGHLTHK